MAQQIDNPFSYAAADCAAAAKFSGYMFIEHIEFTGYAAAADQCEVQDASGNVIWRSTGRADFSTVVSQQIGTTKGLLIPITASDGSPNLVSGRVLIYFR